MGLEIADMAHGAADPVIEDPKMGNEPKIKVAIGHTFHPDAFGQTSNDDLIILGERRRSADDERSGDPQTDRYGTIETG
jgi:hypothetical protein